MLFSRDKDDDDDFVPNPNYRSNLASIFGNPGSGEETNSSLTYTPPKQPRRQNKPSTISAATSSSKSSSLLFAKTVQTFKMVDGAYVNQGKVGAAVLSFGTADGTAYQILLYRDKQIHLCNARILRDFKFHIQPKNYCTFYDKLNTIWSILFDSPADMAEFNLQVAKCRWKAEPSNVPILIQDLWCPVPSSDGSTAAVGDSVELTYTLSTIDNTSEEVSQAQRVVVQVEASGWKQSLVGVQLNTQRVIILQPFMLGDLNPNEVSYNSPVIVKFTVLQVTKASMSIPEPTQVQAVEDIKSQPTDAPKLEASLPDIVEQSASDTPGNVKSSKVDLINRMARMGQALPFKKTAPTPSDSDEPEEDHQSPLQRLSKVVPKPRARVQTTLPTVPAEREVAPMLPPSAVPSQLPMQWTTGMQPYMVGNMYPVPQVSSPLEASGQFNMFLSEVRTTNSELRMGLTRLTDKVDNLHSKVDQSNKSTSSPEIGSVLEKLMEGEKQLKDQLQQVLTTLQNTQLASRNRPVEESVVDSSAPPAVPTINIASAQPCEQCAQLGEAKVTLSEKVKKLEEENEVLQVSLAAQKDALFNAKIADKDQLSQIESLQRQIAEEHRIACELKNSMESLQRSEKSLMEDVQTAKKSIAELQETLREKQSCIDRLEQDLKESETTKLDEVRRNLQEVLDPKPIIEEHIKKISNAVYRMVKVQFEPQNKYDASFIQSVLAETIKAVTLQYLQNENLVSSASDKAVVKGRLDSDTSVNTETLTTIYVGPEQRNTSDDDCKSSDATVSHQSSEASLVSGSQILTENKDAGENQAEVMSNKFDDKAEHYKTSEKLGPTTSADATAKDSSEDIQSILSEKLERVLLHFAQTQNSPDPSLNPLHHSFTTTSSPWASREETQVWRPQPPPPPLFEDEEVNDDWLNS